MMAPSCLVESHFIGSSRLPRCGLSQRGQSPCWKKSEDLKLQRETIPSYTAYCKFTNSPDLLDVSLNTRHRSIKQENNLIALFSTAVYPDHLSSKRVRTNPDSHASHSAGSAFRSPVLSLLHILTLQIRRVCASGSAGRARSSFTSS